MVGELDPALWAESIRQRQKEDQHNGPRLVPLWTLVAGDPGYRLPGGRGDTSRMVCTGCGAIEPDGPDDHTTPCREDV